MTARARLDHALVSLADRRERPPCAEPLMSSLWLSDDRDERERAATECRRCPVLELCADAAEEAGERWHTWGGKDRRPRPGPRAKGAS